MDYDFKSLIGRKVSVMINHKKHKNEDTLETYVGLLKEVGKDWISVSFVGVYEKRSIDLIIISKELVVSIWVYTEAFNQKEADC